MRTKKSPQFSFRGRFRVRGESTPRDLEILSLAFPERGTGNQFRIEPEVPIDPNEHHGTEVPGAFDQHLVRLLHGRQGFDLHKGIADLPIGTLSVFLVALDPEPPGRVEFPTSP